MALNAISEARLTLLHPKLAAAIRQMAEILALDPAPIKLVVSAGLRTWTEQDNLYALGRTLPGKIVTNARGGESWHNYGVASDCAPEIADGTIDWNPSHPQWLRMETVGMSLGLTSGATWIRLVDAPHFQYVAPYPEDAPNELAREIYLDQGPDAFWATIP